MADPEQEKELTPTKGRRKMQLPDKWLGLIGQAIAAAAVIGSNQSAIKSEIAPIKLEQAVLNEKVSALSDKVGRIEKKVGE